MDLNNNEYENFNSPILQPVKTEGSHVNSLNELYFNDENKSKQSKNTNSNYKFERRMGRGLSIYVHPTHDNKFYKLIIPYSFEEKKYAIKEKEIEFYEYKHYLLEKLNFYNSNPVFDIESTYNVKGFKKLNLYLPTIIILLILIYFSLIVCSLCCFNPFVIYTLFSWNRKAYNSLTMFRFILLEKYKMKEIKRNIDNENLSEECQEKKLKWVLGQSGYWLEIQKLID
jgi:hypothetical protein